MTHHKNEDNYITKNKVNAVGILQNLDLAIKNTGR